MSQTLQLKRESASWWTTNNPTLAAGEPGFESDTKRIKVGDGSTAWNDLDYASSWPLAQAIAVGATTPVPGGIGARRWSTTTGCELVWDGAAWIIPAEGVQRVELGADVSNSTTTGADVTGLSVSVVAGVTYVLEAHLTVRSAAIATGIQIALNGPATSMLSISAAQGISATGNTLRNSASWNDFVVATANGTVVAADTPAYIRAHFKPTVNGSVVVRLRSEVAASAVTVRAGSALILRAMGNGGYVVTNPAISVATITGTAYTLSAADNGKHLKCTSALPVLITVPVDLPTGFYTRVSQRGLGKVSFTHATDVAKIRKRDTLLRETAGGDATASLLTDGTDEHLLEGDLAVAP